MVAFLGSAATICYRSRIDRPRFGSPFRLDPFGVCWFDSPSEPLLSFTVLVEPSSMTGKWWTVWLRSTRDIPELVSVLRDLAPHIRVRPDLRTVDSH
jgi:hypothetical protein